MEEKITDQNIYSREEFSALLSTHPAVLAYFSTPDCSVCKVLKPKVKELLASDFPEVRFVYIDCIQHPDIAAQQNVFAVPTIVVFFDGRETIRKSRSFGIGELHDSLVRPYQLLFDTEISNS